MFASEMESSVSETRAEPYSSIVDFRIKISSFQILFGKTDWVLYLFIERNAIEMALNCKVICFNYEGHLNKTSF